MNTTVITPSDIEMIVDPKRNELLISALTGVSERVAAKASGRPVRLVAVSKLKPATDILALYLKGHRDFGENYYQELVEKAAKLPKDIKWHFIGGLQSNKCKPLASTVSNLYLVSSVDSAKKATQLNLGRGSLLTKTLLNVHIQVNTSSETSKSGTLTGTDTKNLALHILRTCPHLNLSGLMTIGSIARSTAVASGDEKDNLDFKILSGERDRLEEALRQETDATDWHERLGVDNSSSHNQDVSSNNELRRLELSMGMSNDYEVAIEMGSDEVRIGSTIFGERLQREKN